MSRPLSDAELLDLLLGQDDPDARRDALAEDPSAPGRAAELEAFLTQCRTVLGEDEAEAAQRASSGDLVGRILADTTREDPSWRGDLRLIRGFVGARLRDSVLLRVVAASLLAHVFLIPVGAWALFGEAEEDEPVHITFEIPREADPEEAPEELSAVRDPRATLDPEVLAAERAQNLLRRHAYLLAHGALPELAPESVDASTDAPLEIRLLVARSRGDGLAVEERETLAAEVLDHGGSLAVALLAELRLDALAIHAERSPDWGTLFNEVRRLAQGEGAPADLARHALDRAVAYGAWEPVSAGGDPSALESPRRPLWRADWGASLQGALAERGLADHRVARAWTAATR